MTCTYGMEESFFKKDVITNITKIKQLVASKIDINLRDEYHQTLLCNACSFGNNSEVIMYLIDSNANLNVQSVDKLTALHEACGIKNHDNSEVINYLVKSKAELNMQSNSGLTPLHNACKAANNIQSIKCLVESKSNLNMQNKYGYIPLLETTYRKDGYEIIKYLIIAKSGIHTKKKYGLRNESRVASYLDKLMLSGHEKKDQLMFLLADEHIVALLNNPITPTTLNTIKLMLCVFKKLNRPLLKL